MNIPTESVFVACDRAMAWERFIDGLDREPFDEEIDDADNATLLAYRTHPTCWHGVAVLAATFLVKEDPDDPAVRLVLTTFRDAANAMAATLSSKGSSIVTSSQHK